MLKRYTLFIFIMSLNVILGCKKDDGNPAGTSGSGLEGTWKTNGIYIYMNPNVGTQLTITFTSGSYNYQYISYRKDSTGNWMASTPETASGNYQLDESFVVLSSEDGGSLHYSIDGNKLTLNSTADLGGIYSGSSNTLTSGTWTAIFTNTSRNSTEIRQYTYNTNGTGFYKDRYSSPSGTNTDSTTFTYSVNGNVLTHVFDNSSDPYVAVHMIKNNKLYMYGKPYTRDNDEYYQYELYRQ